MGTSAHAERRHTPRRPFRGNVELAIADDADGYEADGVDVSIGGMALKTSYLPDIGSELEARFSLEDGASVIARGEVVWAVDAGADAGQFGLRFTDLANADEQSILNSFKKTRAPAREARDARDARPGAAGSAPSADENRARLHIRGMEAPLRARVRTQMDDVIVLGSDLSFLKLGDRVEVERNGDRVAGNIEDVSVEVDGQTRVARLVLTVATGNSSASVALPDEAPRGPMTLEARRPATVASPMPAIANPSANVVPRVETPVRATRAAQATAVLTPEPVVATPPSDALVGSDDENDDITDDAPEVSIDDAPAEPRKSIAPGTRKAPPRWLVSMLASLRAAGAWSLRTAGPALARIVPLLVALSGRITALIRARTARKSAVEAPAPVRGAGSVTLRKQQPATAGAAPVARAAVLSPMRRRYGMYALAALGAAALVFAVVLQQREPPPATPHPQVAVTGTEAAAEPTTAAVNPPVDPAAAPGADPTLAPDPTAAAIAPGAGADPSDPTALPTPAVAPRAPRGLPTDLAAAARSRNADVNDEPPTITNVAARPTRLAAAPVAPTPATAPAHAGAHAIGSTSIRGGTVLRLHMDGPIAAIAGGTAAGNALTFRLSGRRSLDLAAPLVRQDGRLINAGVRNRATGAEITLRFRDVAPAFSARARGDVLEIVLAPGAAATTVHHAQPATSVHPAHPTVTHAAPAPAVRAAPRRATAAMPRAHR